MLGETIAAVRPRDAVAEQNARARLDVMTKPPGSLGLLEDVAAQLAGTAGRCPAPLPGPAAVAVFAGDHGVHAQGVTPWPQEVTGQMVANIVAGGAVVNAFAAQLGAEVLVVDVGVSAPLQPAPGLLGRRVRSGTADLSAGPAMTVEEARRAVEVGIEVAGTLAAGHGCLVTGDMGIANTTASAALVCVFTGADARRATGRGTGIDDTMLARKVQVVRQAAGRVPDRPATPEQALAALAEVGGLEHAALAGFVIGAAAARVPVVLDGIIAGSAALVAAALCPAALEHALAGHTSAEPGHALALQALGLQPLLALDLRLGEGTGALLAWPLVAAAARALRDVATFDSAGVTGK
ncbi:nicotinate-nucleotide--dimethylbenzimidazole phosphoribosyltransferase [Modestobacter sp. I12A-02628]|uniref:Nicotinate-nucleotide--dimethylbenzimidazole phosphoribosyltransferase n=1 Tax=Goekera deserti TaxID=2497753 RepID=A0A7K3WES7_9ACTN|nr:nicotinate-nucleotide--dimethylbenzimidazole phosphoribosyltransferase [Goekera deserti]MPQ98067.1 nicotinate-nucleotide--dimethylbenzimidazole phosphoribosyltransferase [Goekera deserti]NDI48714.1 nicotinate-nucleotide--dimethylbenzimidazole phosphoribosyltransferase [Goekera deserti]NEL54907.1 nicotinate-nucleotide--dimethylbenzimidazole phosphoribosyltransferase [Goekera deserti]